MPDVFILQNIILIIAFVADERISDFQFLRLIMIPYLKAYLILVFFKNLSIKKVDSKEIADFEK